MLAENNDEEEPAAVSKETTGMKPLPSPPPLDPPPPLPPPLDLEVSSDLQAAAERMSAPLASPQAMTSPIKPPQGEVLPPPALGSTEIDGIERPSAESVGEQLSGQLAQFDSSVADELRALRDIATSLRSVGSEPEKPAGSAPEKSAGSEPEKSDSNGTGDATSEGT